MTSDQQVHQAELGRADRLVRYLESHPRWAAEARLRRHAARMADPVARLRTQRLERLLARALHLAIRPEHIGQVRNVLVLMTLTDSAATWLWLRTGVADEGNPIVAAAIDQVGLGAALTIRGMLSASLVVALAWVAQRWSPARLALVVAYAAIGAVIVLHATALGWGVASTLGNATSYANMGAGPVN